MLIPIYVIGFILGGLILFAIAQQIRNRKAKISVRAIGVLAGPVFFAVIAIFSGWKREKTYEVEWLTGNPAGEYLVSGKTTMQENKNVVVLRRYVRTGQQCYNVFISEKLANYVENLPTHTVQVHYTVVYDFFKMRTYYIRSIGEFEYHPDGTAWKTAGDNLEESCFAWFDK